MNEKIPLRALADRVAETTGRSSAEMETLIKRLFELIAEALHEGRKVDVKGLGTFSLSDNPADPVEFSPAVAWAERVNAPFAMFEPEELAAEATESDFDGIRSDTPDCITTEQEIEEAAPIHVYAAIDEATAEEPLPQEAAETATVAADTVAGCEPQPVMSEETTAADTVGPEEHITADTDIIVGTEADSAPVLAESDDRSAAGEPGFDGSRQTTLEVCSPETVCRTAASESECTHEESIISTDNDDAAADNGFSKGFIVGLIVGLAIGALALCCYVMYFVHTSGQPQSIETELIEESPVIAE